MLEELRKLTFSCGEGFGRDWKKSSWRRFVLLLPAGDGVGIGGVDASARHVHGAHLVTCLLELLFQAVLRP